MKHDSKTNNEEQKQPKPGYTKFALATLAELSQVDLKAAESIRHLIESEHDLSEEQVGKPIIDNVLKRMSVLLDKYSPGKPLTPSTSPTVAGFDKKLQELVAKEKEGMQALIDAANKRADTAEKELGKVREQLETAERKIKSKDTVIEITRESQAKAVQALEDQDNAFKTTQKELEDKISDLENKLDSSPSLADLSKLQDQLKQAQKSKEAIASELQTAKEKNSDLEAEVEDLKSKASPSPKEKAELEPKSEDDIKASDAYKSLEKERDHLKSKVEETEQALQDALKNKPVTEPETKKPAAPQGDNKLTDDEFNQLRSHFPGNFTKAEVEKALRNLAKPAKAETDKKRFVMPAGFALAGFALASLFNNKPSDEERAYYQALTETQNAITSNEPAYDYIAFDKSKKGVDQVYIPVKYLEDNDISEIVTALRKELNKLEPGQKALLGKSPDIRDDRILIFPQSFLKNDKAAEVISDMVEAIGRDKYDDISGLNTAYRVVEHYDSESKSNVFVVMRDMLGNDRADRHGDMQYFHVVENIEPKVQPAAREPEQP